jgi:hypothetical protein
MVQEQRVANGLVDDSVQDVCEKLTLEIMLAFRYYALVAGGTYHEVSALS